MEELLETLKAVDKKLAAIESLLQRLPEIHSAVFLQMQEELRAAQLLGRKSTDIFTVAPPHVR